MPSDASKNSASERRPIGLPGYPGRRPERGDAGWRGARPPRRIFLAASVKQKRGDVTERECYESGRKRLTAALKPGLMRCVVHNLLRPPPRLLGRGIGIGAADPFADRLCGV